MLNTSFTFRKSIQTKLSILVLILSLFFAVISVSLQLGITYFNIATSTKKSIEKTADYIIPTITSSYFNEELIQLNQHLEILSHIPFVSNILLFNEHNIQLWTNNISTPEATNLFKTYDLIYQDKYIGAIEIYLDTNAIENATLQKASTAALINLMEAFFVAFLLLIIVQKTISRRMKALATSVDQIDLSNVQKFVIPQCLTQSEDEIGQVARSIQALYRRIRSDFIEKKLIERTLHQHKSLLAEEVNIRTQELDWQNNSNKLLADLSLRLLKGHKTNVEHDVRLSMSHMASLLGVDHIFWLEFEPSNVTYRVSFPEGSDEPTLNFSKMYKLKRWLLETNYVAVVDINYINEDSPTERHFLEEMGIHSLAMFPISNVQKKFGLLVATNNHYSLQWNENKGLLLKRFATMLSELTIREKDHIAMAELQEELIQANERLRVEAETDELTRLLNRRPFNRLLNTALFDAVDEKSVLTIMMIDIDNFKAYNDIYGHLQGDKVLSYVAHAMNQVAIKYSASLARFGGEEFALLMPHSDMKQAQNIAWKLCQAIRELSIPHQACSSGIVTVSIGSVICAPDDDTQPNQLLEAADQCLYKAKRAGRNRAEFKQMNIASNDVSPHSN